MHFAGRSIERSAANATSLKDKHEAGNNLVGNAEGVAFCRAAHHDRATRRRWGDRASKWSVMFLNFNRTSAGAFVITADVVGSMGERAHVQVGRFHQNGNTAIAAARRMARDKGYRYVVVTNRNTKWRFVVVDQDAATTLPMFDKLLFG